MDSTSKPLLSALTLFGWLLTSCATALPRDASLPRKNPYIEVVRAQKQSWASHALRDYVFVVQEHSMVMDLTTANARVVVVDGRVQSASSLLYGGSADLSIMSLPTIEALFDDAEGAATLGKRGVPYAFEATYDATYGFPLRIWSNPRDDLADDESGFDIMCFSTEPTGCAPVWLTIEQCTAASGKVVTSATDRGCGPASSGSIGLINATDACCIYWAEGETDGISAVQCAAAGGRTAECGPMEISLGTVRETSHTCCRAFAR